MNYRQYFNYDEIWGENAVACVDELVEMEDRTTGLYMTLGPAGYNDSHGEMNGVMPEKTRAILKKHGCHIRRLGETDADLQKRGELEAYRQYESTLAENQ